MLCCVVRFQDCCQRAYDAALHLAAWCAELDVASLKSYYEASCSADWFETPHGATPDFGDDSDDEEDLKPSASLNLSLKS